MLIKAGIIFLVCVAIAFIYIIKVIGRNFDAPIKATKNYLQPKIKEVKSSEPVKNLEKPYSPSIARYVIWGLVFSLAMVMISTLSGHAFISDYTTVVLVGLSVILLVFIAAMPYRNKIEIGKMRFIGCFITVLLMWLLMFFIQNRSWYVPNRDMSLFVLYWLSIALSYYCCVHTYKSWFFLLIFWFGPLGFLNFLRGDSSLMPLFHVALFLPTSFIGMRLLIEFYAWTEKPINQA